MYNWQFENWPYFEYNSKAIDDIVIEFASETGEVKGIIDSLPADFRQDAIIHIMLDEAIKTSAIEGEYYSRQDVMSSIKNRLGIGDGTNIRDINARGIAELMVEVRENFSATLSEQMIEGWHTMLFNRSRYIQEGNYRSGEEPMLIVSGRYGKEEVHYEAPPSHCVPVEMKQFIQWYEEFNIENNNIRESLIKTAIAHLYFETIHPFEDGNGRIGRAIVDKCLSESLGRVLVLSISTAIEQNKRDYYEALKTAQRSMDITDWIVYFCETILSAQKSAKAIIRFILMKAKFLDQHRENLNDRQFKVILKMFDRGIDSFEGGMTAKKYISVTKTSKATATRDLQDMVSKEILRPIGGGRSIHYYLNLPD
ncbi:Fic family protein [Zunongwangia endophytica]|uniref:Fic family protein n=1 Tax=Zunongwangia endophytica TaxID=1808945 RepID=A0ABV8H4G5_9FLAO|nr:Fic family protein [Zunongwangia endophytica]MDN3595559.1 Fic family protein [Zunongwangia endophytica]